MISLEKLKILTSLQKLPKKVGDLGKLIVGKSFEKLPEVQSITQSMINLIKHSIILIFYTKSRSDWKIAHSMTLGSLFTIQESL